MRSDEALLLDMLIAAQNVREFVTDLKWEQFAQSRLHQSAVIRELQVIGEAARLISEETKTKHLTVPWGAIAGMRNRIIHEYFRVDLEIIWDIAHHDIDILVEQLVNIIPPEAE
jgi:uncharacterized protein with HEPN domain